MIRGYSLSIPVAAAPAASAAQASASTPVAGPRAEDPDPDPEPVTIATFLQSLWSSMTYATFDFSPLPPPLPPPPFLDPVLTCHWLFVTLHAPCDVLCLGDHGLRML